MSAAINARAHQRHTGFEMGAVNWRFLIGAMSSAAFWLAFAAVVGLLLCVSA